MQEGKTRKERGRKQGRKEGGRKKGRKKGRSRRRGWETRMDESMSTRKDHRQAPPVKS